ncbi:hypothetical protein [Desulfobacula sp.]|uniref:Uncharacterized protein n=1 Tax=Candidatus Desulfatibia vada TaxID=2841696 RepID=A0A8J6P2X9_9BACT|nr:hypothetical protein [Candidatus Desulfatibia vada]MBL6994161.1 hypothetical protein [Desulfobacula sp.]
MSDESLILIFNTRSVIDSSRLKVTGIWFGSRAILWPQDGLKIIDIWQIKGIQEFWISKNTKSLPALQFDKKHPGMLCFENHLAWGWFIKYYNPQANVRLIGENDIYPISLLKESYREQKYTFHLSYMHKLFHDISNLSSGGHIVPCQKVSKWLASLNQPVLEPFKFFSRVQNWGIWNDRIKAQNISFLEDHKTSVVKCIGYFIEKDPYYKLYDQDKKMVSNEANQYFYYMCRSYMNVAGSNK